MGLETASYRLCDPWKKEMSFREVGAYKDVEAACHVLLGQIHRKNTELGKADPFRVCAVHRSKDMHRWFNVEMNSAQNGIRVSREYGGALNHLETLFSQHWRIGSPAEELACEEKDKLEAKNAQSRLHLAGTAFSAANQLRESLKLNSKPGPDSAA